MGNRFLNNFTIKIGSSFGYGPINSSVIGAIESVDFGYEELQDCWNLEDQIRKDWKIKYAVDQKASEIAAV